MASEAGLTAGEARATGPACRHQGGGVNVLIGAFKWVLDIVYMFVAVRAVYRLGTARTLVAAPLLVVGYFACYLLVLGAALASVALS